MNSQCARDNCQLRRHLVLSESLPNFPSDRPPATTSLRINRRSFKILRIDPEGKPPSMVSDVIRPERKSALPKLPGSSNKQRSASHEHHSVRRKSIHQKLKDDVQGDGNRYQNQKLIGEGGTARVFAVEDINCGREVAIKVLKQEQGTDSVHRFIEEVATTCCLQHPYIIPIYDLDIDDSGRPYIAMRRVKGESLADYIKMLGTGSRHSMIANWNDLVSVFLKVCDALSYAHTKGYVHQDIKPENIMLGTFGQIFVIDWGSSSGSDEVAVTPAYMSPQQGQGKRPTPADDIHCLGATLFHSLIGRPPTRGKDIEEVWKRRQAGEVDTPTDDEMKGIPTPLLTIAQKAMASDPNDRYTNIVAMADDLRRYQAGQAVVAHSYSIGELIAIWIKIHRSVLLQAAAVLVLMGIMGTVLYRLKLKEIAYWGAPICVETFDDDSWQDQWHLHRGKVSLQDGRLVTEDRWQELVFKQPINGSWAIEFDGEMLAGHPQGDLSVVLYENSKFEDGSFLPDDAFKTFLQTGAWDNAYSIIIVRNVWAVQSDFRLEFGRKYHLRFEVDNKLLTVVVDGNIICQYETVFPVTTSFPALYLWWPGKAVDNLKLYNKQLPEKVSVLNVADSMYKRGHLESAIEVYGEIERAHADNSVADEARYKRGLAFMRLAEQNRYNEHYHTTPENLQAVKFNHQKAYETWANVHDPSYQDRVDVHFIERSLINNDFEQVAIEIRRQYPSASESKKRLLRTLWQKTTKILFWNEANSWARLYSDLYFDMFPDDQVLGEGAANMLYLQGRYEDILTYFSYSPRPKTMALKELNRYEEAIADTFLGPHVRARALAEIRPEEVEDRYPEIYSECARALIFQSKYEEALNKYPAQGNERALALTCLDHLEKIVEDPLIGNDDKTRALLQLGRYDHLLTEFPKSRQRCFEALVQKGKYDEALQKYSDYSSIITRLLLDLGRYEELQRNFPWRKEQVAIAMLKQNRFEEVARQFQEDRRIMMFYHAEKGDLQFCVERYPEFHDVISRFHLKLGNYDTVISQYNYQRLTCLRAHIFRGDFDMLSKRYGDFYTLRVTNELCRALHQATNDDVQGATQTLQALSSAREDLAFKEGWFDTHILLPFVRAKFGSIESEDLKDIYRQKAEMFPTEFYYGISVPALFLAGDIDENTYHDRSISSDNGPHSLLIKAMGRDLAGEDIKAIAAYRNFLQQPPHLRTEQPALYYLANWRLKALLER